MELKTVGSGGELRLGQEHAGRTVAVEEVESGVWIVKAAHAIPDNELWLHEPSVANTLDKAIRWAEQNPPKATDLSKLEAKLKARTRARTPRRK